ncbi:MAG: radical SAM protein [Planctomycetota bacterium]|nr:radical SAM protein [Planctomycetota bacterium]
MQKREQLLAWAERMDTECRLCPRACGVNRAAGERGWCGAGRDACFFLEFVHWGEEPEIAPSHTIYLMGCNLRCRFCHTAEDRRRLAAVPLTPEKLRALAAAGQAQGARNLNFLGGEPTVNLPALLRLLTAAGEMPAVVWNTNLYCAAETLAAADSIVDIYLPDFKFGNNACSQAIAEAADYWDVARDRLRELYARAKERIILRHLVLPGHVACCTRPVLEFLAQAAPAVRLSLKLDYLVMPASRGDARLGRFLSDAERDEARRLASDLGLRTAAAASAAAVAPPAAPAPDRDFEIVISPRGELYMRVPTAQAARLAADLERDREAGAEG